MKLEDNVTSIEDVVQSSKSRVSSGYLTGKAVEWRRRLPTVFKDGRTSPSPSVARQRRKETFEAAQAIHGGSEVSHVPGNVGLIDTSLVKCSNSLLVDVMSSSNKFKKSIMPIIYIRTIYVNRHHMKIWSEVFRYIIVVVWRVNESIGEFIEIAAIKLFMLEIGRRK